jgi:hypothetical protein
MLAANPTEHYHPLDELGLLGERRGLVLGSRQCLVAEGAVIQAANAAVTVALITISSGATNVSVAGGTLDGNGAYIQGIYAPAAARVNIDKVVVRNCGLDCILLKGAGNSTYDNEMSVTRCDVSGSPAHAGICIQNSTPGYRRGQQLPPQRPASGYLCRRGRQHTCHDNTRELKSPAAATT